VVPTALLFLFEFVVRIGLMVRIFLRGGRQPSMMLAWALVLVAFPLVGIVLYLLVGEVRLGVRRSGRHEEVANRLRAKGRNLQIESYLSEAPLAYRRAMSVAEAAGALPPRGGNRVEILGDTDAIIAGIAEDIDRARRHCHLLFYIFLRDGSGRRVAEALIRAAERGVACRLLVDAVGSHDFAGSALARRLRDAGVHVVEALPVHPLRALFARIDLRNHRKIVVVDGAVAWTGSQNVADASFAPKAQYAPWVDCMLRLEGPTARDLQELFLADWSLDAGETLDELLEVDPPIFERGVPVQVLPTGPEHNSSALRRIVQTACHLAQEEILLTTPYFVPGEAEVEALCTAALRGVRTVLVLPQRNDSLLVAAASRSHYGELLSCGVEIYEYTKGLLHAKTLTVDRGAALVGTANFDRRSFELNYEVSLLVHDSDLASHLRFLQRSYMEDSVRVAADDWSRRPWQSTLGHNMAGVLSPIL